MESFHSLQSFQRFVPLNNSFRMTTKFKPHHFAKKGKCFVQKYAATDMNSKTQLSISSAHAHLCTGDVHPCLLSSFYSIWTQIPFRSSSKIGLLRNCFWFPLCNLLSSPSYHVNHHYDRENLTHSEFSEVKKKTKQKSCLLVSSQVGYMPPTLAGINSCRVVCHLSCNLQFIFCWLRTNTPTHS